MNRIKPWEWALVILVLLLVGIAILLSNKESHAQACANGLPVDSFNGATACGVWPPVAMGTVNSRTVAAATAYQATDPTKVASTNINLTSTAAISLSGGTTNAAIVYVGSTTGVATGTGTPICRYGNSNTGALTIGLNLNTISAIPCHFDLPIGWYFAVVVTSGTVTITDAYEQSVG